MEMVAAQAAEARSLSNSVLTLAHHLTPTKLAFAAPTGADLVIVNVDQEHYFGLDPVGREIWERLEEGLSLAEVCDAVQLKFDVERNRVEGDVLALAQELLDCGLAVHANS